MCRATSFLSRTRFHCCSALAGALLVSSAVLLACGSNAQAALTTYNIVTYSNSLGPDTGWYPGDGAATISGTIVTDGATGYLAPSDIVSASFTFSIPNQGTFTGSAGSANITFSQNYSLYAGLLGSGANNTGSAYGQCLYLLPGANYDNVQLFPGVFANFSPFDQVTFALTGTGTLPNGLSGIVYNNEGVQGGTDLSSLQINDNGNPADAGSPTPYVLSEAAFPSDHRNVISGASVPGTTIGESDMIIADDGTVNSSSQGQGEASSVPEPGTLVIWTLLGSLAAGLGWWRKRKAA